MRNTVRVLLSQVLFVVFVAVCAPPVAAIAIPVGTTSANDLIVNFDFASSASSPPYVSVTGGAGFSGGAVGEVLTIDIFGASDGSGGSLGITTGPWPGFDGGFVFSLSDSRITDGLFSIGFRLSSGTADLTTAFATGHTAAGGIVTRNATSVPEPTTLALLGIGLTGVGFFRRRKRD